MKPAQATCCNQNSRLGIPLYAVAKQDEEVLASAFLMRNVVSEVDEAEWSLVSWSLSLSWVEL